MDTPTNDQQPVQQQAPIPRSTEPVKKNSSWGVIIGILIIMAVIVVGAFYAWGKRISEQPGFTALLHSEAVRV